MDRLDKYFKEYNKIDEDTDYETFYMQAKELINPRRIDIIVKYYYIKARETGQNLEFAREMYEKHIEAFSDGTFKEQGDGYKNSLKKYFEVFDKLIDDFKENGFNEKVSLVPIGKYNEILDGAHRVACALYFKEDVKVIKFDNLSVDYGFEFFKKRLLDDFYLNFIAKEYVALDRDVYVMFVWPKIGNMENNEYIKNSLEKDNFNIIYQKKIKLDKKGLWNVIFNTYKDEFWVGSPRNNFKGVDKNTSLNYSECGYFYVYILGNTNFESIINKKKDLRKHFKVGTNSVHTFDTPEESIAILDMILDKDFDQVLYQNFLNTKDVNYTFIKYIKRRLRYLYRKTIDKIKSIIGKPV